MKHQIITLLLLVVTIIACSTTTTKKENKVVVKKKQSYFEYIDSLNKELDSLTALGEYILVRGSDRNYDTIIDHVRYIYTTDE
jgi:hypothetical protein